MEVLVVQMKRVRWIISGLLAGALLAGCGAVPLGDGGSARISEQGVTITDGDGQSSLHISKGEGSVTTTHQDSDGQTVTTTVSQDIPDGLPAGITIPADAANVTGMDVAGADADVLTVSFEVNDTAYAFSQPFVADLQSEGWELAFDPPGFNDRDAKMINLGMKRDNESVALSILPARNDGTILVSIIYTQRHE